MKAHHPIRCRCGKLQAEVTQPHLGTRAVCYCRDCQAYAHFLGLPPGMLDSMGGTDIVAIPPRFVSFTRGIEHLACMSLTAKGTLRWYSSCCRTPIGNTHRDFRFSHVGLVHTCLESGDASLLASFGPVKMRVNRHGAKGCQEAMPTTTFAIALLRYLGFLGWSRVSGRYKLNPFFEAGTGMPRVSPKVLSEDEHRELMRAV
jgi:Family of unknown function (DUF6151)